VTIRLITNPFPYSFGIAIGKILNTSHGEYHLVEKYTLRTTVGYAMSIPPLFQ
jgi:hypothetical protein